MSRENHPWRLPNRMLERQRLQWEDIDRRLEAAGQHQVGQRVKVNHVRAADQNEHRARLNLREQLTREQRLILIAWGGQYKDDLRRLEELRKRNWLNALAPKIPLTEPGVVDLNRTVERRQ